MSTLFEQVAGPQYDSTKHPRAYDTCQCGNPKTKRSKRCRNCLTPRSPIDPFTYVEDGRPFRRIPLTQGLYALVDAVLYAWLMQWIWYAVKCPQNNSFYAVRTIRRIENRKRRTIPMHRQITNAGDDDYVDHIESGHTLDNRQSNLRVCTQAQNIANSRKHVKSASRYKGVTWFKRRNCWRAQITRQRKAIHIGYFPADAEADAARAYNAKAVELFGEFARLNVIE